MWIERITVDHFLVFDEAAVELGPGLNVVLSPNEGGKSSLFRAIRTALFTDVTTKSTETKKLARWGSEKLFKIEIELWLGGSRYRIMRDFRSREQAVYRQDAAAPVAKGKAVGEFLRSRLPLFDENLFLRVSGVRHEDLAKVCDGEASIGEKLEEILGGGWGEATPARVAETLDEKRAELLKGADRPALEKNWGPVKRLREAIAAGERERSAAESAARTREELLRFLSSIGSKIEEIDAKLAKLEEKLARARQCADLAGRVEEKEAAAETMRKRLERLRELGALREAHTKNAERFPRELRDLEAKVREERRRALEREGLLEGDLAREAERPRRIPVAGAVAACALTAAGIVGGLAWNRFLFLAAGLGVALLIYLFSRRSGGEPASVGEKRREMSALAKARRAWAGERSLADSAKLLREFDAWMTELDTIDIRLEEAVGSRGTPCPELMESLDAEYGRLSRDLRGLEEELKLLEPFRLDADEILSLEREARLAREAKPRLERERASGERALAGLPPFDLNGIRERIESAREGLAEAERRVEVIDIILEALSEARGRMSGFLAEKLPPLAAGYLSTMTGGRYSALFIDAVHLGVETVPAAKDVTEGAAGTRPERVAPDVLSQGARDQIHLAVRLALVSLLAATEPQPIFLDDPFVHFDPERRRRALDLVVDFARGHQVVLFTCDPAYRDLGAHLVELGGGSTPA